MLLRSDWRYNRAGENKSIGQAYRMNPNVNGFRETVRGLHSVDSCDVVVPPAVSPSWKSVERSRSLQVWNCDIVNRGVGFGEVISHSK